ncbi:MAG: pyridoxamine 5'-phosphate oxidase family protein [Solirubrobacteraceae bacterium]
MTLAGEDSSPSPLPPAADDARPSAEMLELPRAECLRLLAASQFGRIAVNGASVPIIRPVNYVFDAASQSVIFRTASGTKLHALLKSASAVFEIDGNDPAALSGWSVIIIGITEEVTDRSEIRRLETIGVDPWPPGVKSHWLRVRARVVSGRRIAVSG